jgi:hypothetical protein
MTNGKKGLDNPSLRHEPLSNPRATIKPMSHNACSRGETPKVHNLIYKQVPGKNVDNVTVETGQQGLSGSNLYL